MNPTAWPRSSSRCDGDEFTDGLELAVGRRELVRRPDGRRHRRRVLKAGDHVAHRAVTDVGDGAGDGDGRLAGGGHHIGGDAVDADREERPAPGFAGRGGARAGCAAARRADRRSSGDPAARRRLAGAVTTPDRSRSLGGRAGATRPRRGGTVAGVRVGLGAAPRRAGRQRRQGRRAVGLQQFDQFVGHLGQPAFIGVGQSCRAVRSTGTQATSVTSTSSSHNSPPENRSR